MSKANEAVQHQQTNVSVFYHLAVEGTGTFMPGGGAVGLHFYF